MKSFGSVIYKSRKAKGWTIQEVASKVGVYKSYICDIENEVVGPPRPKISGKIAKVLGLDAKDLLRRAWAERAPKEIRAELLDLLFPDERD